MPPVGLFGGVFRVPPDRVVLAIISAEPLRTPVVCTSVFSEGSHPPVTPLVSIQRGKRFSRQSDTASILARLLAETAFVARVVIAWKETPVKVGNLAIPDAGIAAEPGAYRFGCECL
jgi:hypothetical protein